MGIVMKNEDLDHTFMPYNILAMRIKEPSHPYPENTGFTNIRLAGFEPRSLVAGPGIRSVVWVAGCHRRCPNCSQPEYFSFQTGEDISVDNLWSQISQVDGIDGVTFSGGEPFEQVQSLARLAKLVRENGMNVVSYTGYRQEALAADPTRFGPLLNEIDLLIDGEYRSELGGSYQWRGSGNQRLLYLTDRIKKCPEKIVSEMQISFDSNKQGFALSGIWPKGVVNELIRELDRRGFPMRPERSPPKAGH